MAVKILSVDDELPLESLLRQYFRREIRSGQYEFLFAHNGREALDVLSENPDIEVILSDINMPGMDGLTLLAKVNEMRNPLLRVVMVSAYGDMKNIRQAMNKAVSKQRFYGIHLAAAGQRSAAKRRKPPVPRCFRAASRLSF